MSVEFSCTTDAKGKKEVKHFDQHGNEDTEQYVERNWAKHQIAARRTGKIV